MEAILGSIVTSFLGGGSGGGDSGGGSTVAATPTDMSGFFKAILDNYSQVDDTEKGTIKNMPDSMLTLVRNLAALAKTQADEFSKAKAITDGVALVEEAATIATSKLDALLSRKANYDIPRITTEMEASGGYESTCTQLLACDAIAQLDIDGMFNDVASAKLRVVELYSKAGTAHMRESSNAYNVYANAYEIRDLTKERKNHLNVDDVAGEATTMTIIMGIMDLAMTKLWQPFMGGEQSSATETVTSLGILLPAIAGMLGGSESKPPTVPNTYNVHPVKEISQFGGVQFKSNPEMLRDLLSMLENDLESCNNPLINDEVDAIIASVRLREGGALPLLEYLRDSVVQDPDVLVKVNDVIDKIIDGTCVP